MECVKWGTAAEWLIGEETDGQHAHHEYKCLKVHQHAGFIGPIEAAAALGEMGAEAVEGHHKTGDVEGIADKDALTIKGDDGGPTAQDWDESIIAHPNLKIKDSHV